MMTEPVASTSNSSRELDALDEVEPSLKIPRTTTSQDVQCEQGKYLEEQPGPSRVMESQREKGASRRLSKPWNEYRKLTYQNKLDDKPSAAKSLAPEKIMLLNLVQTTEDPEASTSTLSGDPQSNQEGAQPSQSLKEQPSTTNQNIQYEKRMYLEEQPGPLKVMKTQRKVSDKSKKRSHKIKLDDMPLAVENLSPEDLMLLELNRQSPSDSQGSTSNHSKGTCELDSLQTLLKTPRATGATSSFVPTTSATKRIMAEPGASTINSSRDPGALGDSPLSKKLLRETTIQNVHGMYLDEPKSLKVMKSRRCRKQLWYESKKRNDKNKLNDTLLAAESLSPEELMLLTSTSNPSKDPCGLDGSQPSPQNPRATRETRSSLSTTLATVWVVTESEESSNDSSKEPGALGNSQPSQKNTQTTTSQEVQYKQGKYLEEHSGQSMIIKPRRKGRKVLKKSKNRSDKNKVNDKVLAAECPSPGELMLLQSTSNPSKDPCGLVSSRPPPQNPRATRETRSSLSTTSATVWIVTESEESSNDCSKEPGALGNSQPSQINPQSTTSQDVQYEHGKYLEKHPGTPRIKKPRRKRRKVLEKYKNRSHKNKVDDKELAAECPSPEELMLQKSTSNPSKDPCGLDGSQKSPQNTRATRETRSSLLTTSATVWIVSESEESSNDSSKEPGVLGNSQLSQKNTQATTSQDVQYEQGKYLEKHPGPPRIMKPRRKRIKVLEKSKNISYKNKVDDKVSAAECPSPEELLLLKSTSNPSKDPCGLDGSQKSPQNTQATRETRSSLLTTSATVWIVSESEESSNGSSKEPGALNNSLSSQINPQATTSQDVQYEHGKYLEEHSGQSTNLKPRRKRRKVLEKSKNRRHKIKVDDKVLEEECLSPEELMLLRSNSNPSKYSCKLNGSQKSSQNPRATNITRSSLNNHVSVNNHVSSTTSGTVWIVTESEESSNDSSREPGALGDFQPFQINTQATTSQDIQYEQGKYLEEHPGRSRIIKPRCKRRKRLENSKNKNHKMKVDDKVLEAECPSPEELMLLKSTSNPSKNPCGLDSFQPSPEIARATLSSLPIMSATVRIVTESEESPNDSSRMLGALNDSQPTKINPQDSTSRKELGESSIDSSGEPGALEDFELSQKIRRAITSQDVQYRAISATRSSQPTMSNTARNITEPKSSTSNSSRDAAGQCDPKPSQKILKESTTHNVQGKYSEEQPGPLGIVKSRRGTSKLWDQSIKRSYKNKLDDKPLAAESLLPEEFKSSSNHSKNLCSLDDSQPPPQNRRVTRSSLKTSSATVQILTEPKESSNNFSKHPDFKTARIMKGRKKRKLWGKFEKKSHKNKLDDKRLAVKSELMLVQFNEDMRKDLEASTSNSSKEPYSLESGTSLQTSKNPPETSAPRSSQLTTSVAARLLTELEASTSNSSGDAVALGDSNPSQKTLRETTIHKPSEEQPEPSGVMKSRRCSGNLCDQSKKRSHKNKLDDTPFTAESLSPDELKLLQSTSNPSKDPCGLDDSQPLPENPRETRVPITSATVRILTESEESSKDSSREPGALNDSQPSQINPQATTSQNVHEQGIYLEKHPGPSRIMKPRRKRRKLSDKSKKINHKNKLDNKPAKSLSSEESILQQVNGEVRKYRVPEASTRSPSKGRSSLEAGSSPSPKILQVTRVTRSSQRSSSTTVRMMTKASTNDTSIKPVAKGDFQPSKSQKIPRAITSQDVQNEQGMHLEEQLKPSGVTKTRRKLWNISENRRLRYKLNDKPLEVQFSEQTMVRQIVKRRKMAEQEASISNNSRDSCALEVSQPSQKTPRTITSQDIQEVSQKSTSNSSIEPGALGAAQSSQEIPLATTNQDIQYAQEMCLEETVLSRVVQPQSDMDIPWYLISRSRKFRDESKKRNNKNKLDDEPLAPEPLTSQELILMHIFGDLPKDPEVFAKKFSVDLQIANDSFQLLKKINHTTRSSLPISVIPLAQPFDAFTQLMKMLEASTSNPSREPDILDDSEPSQKNPRATISPDVQSEQGVYVEKQPGLWRFIKSGRRLMEFIKLLDEYRKHPNENNLDCEPLPIKSLTPEEKLLLKLVQKTEDPVASTSNPSAYPQSDKDLAHPPQEIPRTPSQYDHMVETYLAELPGPSRLNEPQYGTDIPPTGYSSRSRNLWDGFRWSTHQNKLYDKPLTDESLWPEELMLLQHNGQSNLDVEASTSNSSGGRQSDQDGKEIKRATTSQDVYDEQELYLNEQLRPSNCDCQIESELESGIRQPRKLWEAPNIISRASTSENDRDVQDLYLEEQLGPSKLNRPVVSVPQSGIIKKESVEEDERSEDNYIQQAPADDPSSNGDSAEHDDEQVEDLQQYEPQHVDGNGALVQRDLVEVVDQLRRYSSPPRICVNLVYDPFEDFFRYLLESNDSSVEEVDDYGDD